jgi:acyl dehydratase
MGTNLEAHMKATITADNLERLRRRIGIATKLRGRPFNSEIHPDSVRHWVNGAGDDNPLFCDAGYAASSPWGEVVAPLNYLNTMGEVEPDARPWTESEQEAMGGGDPLRGIHAFYSGTSWEWWKPLRLGRRVFKRTALIGVHENRSEFAERSVFLPRATAFRDDTGDLLASQQILMIHTERATAAKKGKYKEIVRHHYTADELAEIDRTYAEEHRQGSVPRYWEDVEVGPIPHRMVKGPLVVTDIIFWHVGGNETFYNLSPLRLAWKNRQRIPAFYLPNQFGAWDAAQRGHWDDELAQAVGNPYAYDYGAMREAWLAQFMYNWMGDAGWLWRFHSEMRRFNYIGDVTWISGKVTDKYEVDGQRFCVDVELEGRNQRDEVSTVGRATVLLPTRQQPHVVLPEPPDNARDLDSLFAALINQSATNQN